MPLMAAMEQCEECKRPINTAVSPIVTVHTADGPLHYHADCVPWRAGGHHVFKGKGWAIESIVAAALARRLELMRAGTVIITPEEIQHPPGGMIFHPMTDGGIAIEIQP